MQRLWLWLSIQPRLWLVVLLLLVLLLSVPFVPVPFALVLLSPVLLLPMLLLPMLLVLVPFVPVLLSLVLLLSVLDSVSATASGEAAADQEMAHLLLAQELSGISRSEELLVGRCPSSFFAR